MLLVIKQHLIDSVHCHHLEVTSIGDRVKILGPSVRSCHGFVVDRILVVRQLPTGEKLPEEAYRDPDNTMGFTTSAFDLRLQASFI